MPLFISKSLRITPKDLLTDSKSSINIYIMDFLLIDCSIEKKFLFLKVKNSTFSKYLQSNKNNNDLLMVKILEFLDKNKINFKNIPNIIVNSGPGSFSGIRSSIATAKGICLVKKINLMSYNNFILTCAKFYKNKDPFYCILEYQKKFFIQKFGRHLSMISKPKIISFDEILKYNKFLKVIPKKSLINFDQKIQKVDNLHLIDLNYHDIMLLYKKKLLENKEIKPLYLT